MPLKMRLARAGAKKKPFYRIVIADSRAPRDGRYIDKIGTYNPMLGKTDAQRVILEADKVKDWLAKGAQPTDRVARFLDVAGIATRAARANPKKAVPGAKMTERAEKKAAKSADGEAAAG